MPATLLGHREARGVEIVKPLVTLILLAAAIVSTSHHGLSATRILVCIGLSSTVVADRLLAPVDNSRTFLAGLVFFLVGYLVYGVALLAGPSAPIDPVRAASVYVPLLAIGALQFRTLGALPREMRVPVAVYMIVVSNLLAAGILAFAASRAWLALVATVLIYLSDSLIAHNLYRKPLPYYQIWIMSTYYVGQIAIVASLTV